MAQKHSVHYVSDLSGKDIVDNDAPTVSFGWDGTDYTIDLTTDEAEKFYKAMEKYLSVATRVKAKSSTRGKASSSKSDAAEIRAWAQSNGIEVPDRGRIPATVREQYEAAS